MSKFPEKWMHTHSPRALAALAQRGAVCRDDATEKEKRKRKKKEKKQKKKRKKREENSARACRRVSADAHSCAGMSASSAAASVGTSGVGGKDRFHQASSKSHDVRAGAFERRPACPSHACAGGGVAPTEPVPSLFRRAANILAAKGVADAVRTSLGPRGMDKMIQVRRAVATGAAPPPSPSLAAPSLTLTPSPAHLPCRARTAR